MLMWGSRIKRDFSTLSESIDAREHRQYFAQFVPWWNLKWLHCKTIDINTLIVNKSSPNCFYQLLCFIFSDCWRDCQLYCICVCPCDSCYPTRSPECFSKVSNNLLTNIILFLSNWGSKLIINVMEQNGNKNTKVIYSSKSD